MCTSTHVQEYVCFSTRVLKFRLAVVAVTSMMPQHYIDSYLSLAVSCVSGCACFLVALVYVKVTVYRLYYQT